MALLRRFVLRATCVLCALILYACGGGGGNSESNSAPSSTGVNISDDNGGLAEIGDRLSGSYIYSDAESDVEGTTTFRWLRDSVAIGGETSANYTLVLADAETQIVFEVTPVALTGVTTGQTAASAAIGVESDPTAALSIDNPSIQEGDVGFTTELVFRLSLDKDAPGTVTVDYEAIDGTALELGGDYNAVTGMATFAQGTRIADVSVFINGDATFEDDELINLTTSNPQGIQLVSDSVTGSGMILNDDFTPGTAWDISTAWFSGNFYDGSPLDANITDMAFKSDGTKMYVMGERTDNLYQVSVDVPWDLSETTSYDSISLDVSAEALTAQGFDIKTDGSSIYIVDSASDSVFQYDLSIAWDLSTAIYSGNSISLSPQAFSPTGVRFKPDGLVMYVTDESKSAVFQYDLASAWDVSTSTFSNNSLVLDPNDIPFLHGIEFNNDGSKFYVSGVSEATFNPGRILQYSLSTPWDISTGSRSAILAGGGATTRVTRGIFFKPDGLVFYVTGSSPDNVFQYEVH